MQRLLECVPNFSEGRNPEAIGRIAEAISAVPGVKLLDIDPGHGANRTVMTFAGEPNSVIEAAFQAIKAAAEVIDMQEHEGVHPRMGATDVCPLIPLSGITMEEVVELSKKLAERVGEELQIPVFLYEHSASAPNRKNLSSIRSGNYEGMAEKLHKPEWQPDFGPAELNKKAGVTAIGARDFLIAYNVNLNTKDTKLAHEIAEEIRESGRAKQRRELSEKTSQESSQNNQPGLLKSVKAIGWYIEEFGVAQVSMNLTNLHHTPLHVAFEHVEQKAQEKGLRVTGSEIVGMVPLWAMKEAGRHFLHKQGRSTGVDEQELVWTAINSLGLDSVKPFEPQKKIIEYMLREQEEGLAQLTVREMLSRISSDAPTPGGGSTAAITIAMASALGAMTANLTAHNAKDEESLQTFSKMAARAQDLKEELLALADADANAFDSFIKALRMPKDTDAEKEERKQKVADAKMKTIEVPLQVMEKGLEIMDILQKIISQGKKSYSTDAEVGLKLCRAAVDGAFLNVEVNCENTSNLTLQEKLHKARQILQQVK